EQCSLGGHTRNGSITSRSKRSICSIRSGQRGGHELQGQVFNADLAIGLERFHNFCTPCCSPPSLSEGRPLQERFVPVGACPSHVMPLERNDCRPYAIWVWFCPQSLEP